MEPAEDNKSDSSSTESDRNQPEKPNEDNAAAAASGVGRSYECIFCKRGFTNAQALGGHMNIHRNDKAKANKGTKHKNQEDTFKSSENYKNLSYTPQISSGEYSRTLGAHVNYQVYLPSSNPSFQTGNYQYNYLPVWRPDHHMDAHLGLRIGVCPSHVEDEDEDEDVEVDLELRLGQYR